MLVLRKTISLLFMITIIVSIISANCSSNSPTAANSGDDISVSFSLQGGMQNIQLPANQVTHFTITLQVPPEIKRVDSATIDVKETLRNTSVAYQGNLLKAAWFAASSQNAGSILIKVGDTPEAACASTITYGPYNLAPGFFGSPDPEEITLDQPSIQIVNRGTVALCLEMQSSVDAMLSLEEVSVDVMQSDCSDAADFSGTWVGTYQCENSCGPAFGGEIELTITQDGTSASYVDDGQHRYTGTVCGDTFRFTRSDADETESGTLTLIDENRAVKRSTYRSRSQATCFGDCLDSLYRVDHPGNLIK